MGYCATTGHQDCPRRVPCYRGYGSHYGISCGTRWRFLVKNPSWALDFAPNGTRLGLGDIITRKRYADTLEAIADQGPDAFYTGPIAKTMINAIQAANGTMTLDDLRSYSVAIRNVSQIDYRGFKVTSTTAPSSGIVAMSALKTLNTCDNFFAPDNVNLSAHRMDEAIRFGYGEVCGCHTFVFQSAWLTCDSEPTWAILRLLKGWDNTKRTCWSSPL